MLKHSSSNLSPAKRWELCKALDAALVRNSDGSIRWKSSRENDNTIAQRFGVSLWTVQNQRRQMFGSPFSGGGDGNTIQERIWEHIKSLEEQVQSHEEQIQQLRTEFNNHQHEMTTDDKLSSTPKQ